MERRFRGVAILALAMVAMVIAFTGCIGNQNSGSSGTSVTQAKVVIDYNGTWNGSVGQLLDLKNVNGTGHKEITVDKGNSSVFQVSALVHKSDASNATLTVSIEYMNGTVIKSDSTSTPFGIAAVTATVK